MNPPPFPVTGYDAEIRRTVPQYDEFFRIICSAVRSHLPDNPVDWLDVGCGTGRMFEEAAEKIPLRSFAFADSSSEMLETARRRFSEVSVPTQFFVCRAEKIGKTGKYDVVSSVLVNHYLNGCARRNIGAPGRRCARAAFISFLKITIRKQKKNTFYAVMNG